MNRRPSDPVQKPGSSGLDWRRTCRSRCPECGRVCRADHRNWEGEGQVGQVYLQAARLNDNGYLQTFHGHPAGHSHRTGFYAHSWWLRPSKRTTSRRWRVANV